MRTYLKAAVSHYVHILSKQSVNYHRNLIKNFCF